MTGRGWLTDAQAEDLVALVRAAVDAQRAATDAIRDTRVGLVDAEALIVAAGDAERAAARAIRALVRWDR